MSELKTLEDFIESDNPEWICALELKQEAIKWVKYRNIKIDSDFCEFLNITEEDLK